MTINFNSNARTADKAGNLVSTISNSDRASLKPTELEKLRQNCIEPLPEKFQLIRFTEGDRQLDQNYNITMAINEAKQHCQIFGMDEVFDIVVPDPDQTSNPGKIVSSRSLFDHYSSITVDEVRASIEHFRIYGQDYHLQNLQWSEEFFKSSCAPDLRMKIAEKTREIPNTEKGGPLYFLYMIKTILHLSEEGARVMLRKIQTMKVTDFEGEDVDKVVSLLRASIDRLKSINKLPFDIERQLFGIFRSCSVPDFSDIFKAMEHTHTLHMKTFTVEEILKVAEDEFQRLSQTWSNAARPKSSFIASSTATCWNCGEPGHTFRSCPKPKNPRSPYHPYRQAPSPGEPHKKKMFGKERLWCGKCHNWGNHLTQNHIANFKSQPPTQPNANLLSTTKNATDTLETSLPTSTINFADSDDTFFDRINKAMSL